jgi:hypothetical protein
MRVVLDGELRERWSLDVRDADGVERDVDAARVRGHRVGVLVDGSLVERVDLRRLRLPPRATISSATRSSVSRVRPARKTLAPSRANARATAAPIAPPPP